MGGIHERSGIICMDILLRLTDLNVHREYRTVDTLRDHTDGVPSRVASSSEF